MINLTEIKPLKQLKNIFHRQIDIIIGGSVKNPYLKASIDQTRKNIYAA